MMSRAVFLDHEFAKYHDQYVCVYVDFPRGAAAVRKVQDQERNARLGEHFEVEGFPTVVLTDAQGQPYSTLGYDDGGMAAFIRDVSSATDTKQKRDALLAKVGEASGKQQLQAATEAIAYLRELEYATFYGPTYETWYAIAEQEDPANKLGLNEVIFEAHWQASISEAMLDQPEKLAPHVGFLDTWKQSHTFQDQDRAARMHLQAAWLVREEDPDAVIRYAAEGLAYTPNDDSLRQMLGQLKRAAASRDILGTGSGFLVADGYIVTNNHVVRGPGKLVVRLPGVEKPVPGKVIANDPRVDLAVIKIDPPTDLQLEPLRFSTDKLGRGTDVGAFGYPLGDAYGKGLKLTTGVVSATVDQTDNGMLLLDCRVNPGNSGGPLCNTEGHVVGVVTAKSRASSDVDSYGMAVPTSKVLEFLSREVPTFKPLEDENPFQQTEQQWSEIDRQVSPAVLMILKLREETEEG